jgi:hypothetical protein
MIPTSTLKEQAMDKNCIFLIRMFFLLYYFIAEKHFVHRNRMFSSITLLKCCFVTRNSTNRYLKENSLVKRTQKSKKFEALHCQSNLGKTLSDLVGLIANCLAVSNLNKNVVSTVMAQFRLTTLFLNSLDLH